jgi:hypothetical protein
MVMDKNIAREALKEARKTLRRKPSGYEANDDWFEDKYRETRSEKRRQPSRDRRSLEEKWRDGH